MDKIKYLSDLSLNEFINPKTSKINRNRCKIVCPGCGRVFSFLKSKFTRLYDLGKRFRTENYFSYGTKCRKCRQIIKLIAFDKEEK